MCVQLILDSSTSGGKLTESQLTSLTKILKCAKDNDVVTLKAADDADALGMVFESPSQSFVTSRCFLAP